MVNPRKPSLVATIPVLAVLLFSPACVFLYSPKVWVEEQRDLEFPSGDLESVRVITDNGAIHVHASGDAGAQGVIVQARVRAGGQNEEDARECLKAIEIETPQSDSARTVQARWIAPRRSGWARSVSYEIHLPARLALELTSDNGAIEVTGVKGPCRLLTDNGSITLRGGEGDLRAETDNGKIDVETRARTVHLLTDNGAITAVLGGAGSLAGSVTTDNGSITLDLADDVSTEIELRTDNGRITNKLPLDDATKSKDALQGRLGGGGGRLKVLTDNGSITVR